MPPSHMIATAIEVVSVVVVDGTSVVVVVVRVFSSSCLVVGVIAGKIVDDIVVVDNRVVIVFSIEFVVDVTSDNVLAKINYFYVINLLTFIFRNLILENSLQKARIKCVFLKY